MKVILLGIGLNVVLGVLVSLLNGKFSFHHLSNFLHEMVLPYVVVYALFKVAVDGFPHGVYIWEGAYLLIVLTLLAGIWEKLGHFGLPTPRWLTKGER